MKNKLLEVKNTAQKTNPILRSSRSPQMLLEITNELAMTETLDDALAKLVEKATELLGAERGTIFMNDGAAGELYSRVVHGDLKREIRILNNSGVAGWVFTNEKSAIIHDAYKDERFNDGIDKRTGFKTENILCTPLKTLSGEKIGVSQILNKKQGQFTEMDLELLEAITQQAAIALQTKLVVEQSEQSRKQESEFLDIVGSVSSEINLGPLLQKIISAITKMLDAERSTLFLHDERSNELYTMLGEGLGQQLRLPSHVGIVGAVFQSSKTINIPYAYADLRFNPSFDRKTGFFTRSILCMPVLSKQGKNIGVTQVLNKRGGPFTEEDEARLSAFTSQISVGLENAKLFDDVQNMKNYNESMLESMSNGVITIDQDGKIVTCNAASLRIMKAKESEVVGKLTEEFFSKNNPWILERIRKVQETGTDVEILDAGMEFAGEKVSVNVNVRPLVSVKNQKLGSMVVFEDISSEKRMKQSMSVYLDPSVAEQLMASGAIEGKSSVSTVLFSDIRSFTTITELLGAQGTVSLLNEYFTIMVDECIQREGGILDKFIGDAIMAVFGAAKPHDDDPDRALRSAIAMMTELKKYNDRRKDEGKKPIDHGIGINTDEVVSGNIGSAKRRNYTIIGDGVNLAARLESACKQYGAHILISEFTFRGLRATYRTREIDQVIVQGKTKPIGVYEVLDYHTPDSFPHIVEVLRHFSNGIGKYKAAEWDAAIREFQQALEYNPKDKASTTYLERCEQLKANPPKEWDGVWVMKTK